MPDYIDDEKILDCIDLLIADDDMGHFVFTGDDIENILDADVASIVHGHWMTWEEKFPGRTTTPKCHYGCYCSVCGNYANHATTYCAHCGAKMEKDNEDQT